MALFATCMRRNVGKTATQVISTMRYVALASMNLWYVYGM